MAKYYFSIDNEENCYPLKYWKEYKEENELKKLELIEAKIETGESYFWCTFYQTTGEVGEGCGIQCEEYKPRNGKNGRCRFSNNCYEQTDKKIII
jgi:hypothetical protein